jgi:Domain of unknown function DUF1828
MKERLCKAFCDELAVRDVPAGLAVSTPFTLSSGEPLGFYIVGPDVTGRYQIEDDGTTMPLIEAAGIDLETQTRGEAVASLLEEYGAVYDDERGELSTPPTAPEEVPQRALLFVALLLRLQDLLLLKPERVASTFKEDATRAIKEAIGDRAKVSEDEAPAPGVDIPADLLIRAPKRPPVAVFLAMTDQRVLEAVVAQMAATYEVNSDSAVVALLEKDASVTRRVRQRAVNRLAAMLIYGGEEHIAVQRIVQEVFARRAAAIH